MTREDRLMIMTAIIYSSANHSLHRFNQEEAYQRAKRIEKLVQEDLLKEGCKKLKKAK